MSSQKITPNIPMVKIMNPILRILLILACTPLTPANNPVKENRPSKEQLESGKLYRYESLHLKEQKVV